MKRILLMITTMMLIGAECVFGAQPIKIKLWPDGAPTKNGFENTEEKWEGAKVYQVSDPELWIYPAKNPNGQAIVCAPGGGYRLLSTDNEGTMFINWLNTQGITLAILKYRLPNGNSEIPLEDSRRAMQIMREKASEYGYNPNEIGIMGFSAGGHFAAMLATMYGDKEYRPDFQILFYPVITMKNFTHKGSRKHLLGENPTPEQIEKFSLENRVTPDTPPAFVVLASDDKSVPPLNSLKYVEALQKNEIPYSLHIYPVGHHGFGFRDTNPYKPEMSMELSRWLRSIRPSTSSTSK